MNITIKGEAYSLIRNYKENESLRNSFNALTQKTYRFDFDFWFKAGYWGEKYIPYSLLKDDKVVANVSVNIIDFSILGEKKRYVQIGTVMTDTAYRNLGLSKYLMEVIIKEWEPNCDLIYLFANNTVLDFYPKFGFLPAREYEHSKTAPFSGAAKSIQQLDMSNSADQQFLYELISHTAILSKVSMLDNPGLVMFYCLSYMREEVFYIADYKAIAIVSFEDNTCYLQDVFSKEPVSLDDIIASVVREDTVKVTLGFTPDNAATYEVGLLPNDVDALFVKPDIADFLKKHQLRFPLLSHA